MAAGAAAAASCLGTFFRASSCALSCFCIFARSDRSAETSRPEAEAPLDAGRRFASAASALATASMLSLTDLTREAKARASASVAPTVRILKFVPRARKKANRAHRMTEPSENVGQRPAEEAVAPVSLYRKSSSSP